MKSIYLLERLHHILNALPEEDQKQAEHFLKDTANYYDHLNTPAAIVTDLIKAVTEDIRREEAKTGGKLAQQKAAEKILDQVPKGKYSGGYMSGDRQIVGGAYSVVRLCSPLPVREYPAGKNHLDYDGFINSAKENAGAVLELPTLADLKTHIKIDKAAHKGQKGYIPSWDFGEELPRVNAAYLLEVLTILGDCKAVCSKASPTQQAIYFMNNSGDDAILLPVRKKEVKQ